jgi:elongation factor G
VLVVNKLDRERSSFDQVVNSVQEAFGRGAVPVQLPMGAEKNFTGIIDLIQMRAYTYKPGGDGKGQPGEIPESYVEAATKAHETVVEMIAEGNDELLEEFFATGTLPVEHIISGLQLAMQERRIFPILCCAATPNVGTDCLLNFIGELCPPAEECALVKQAAQANGQSTVIAFKTASDPFAGRISYFKVLSGVVKDNAHLLNTRSQANEKLGHIATPFGKAMHTVPELRAGDIGVVAKLKDTLTGDMLCEKANGFQIPRMQTPEPSLAYGIAAKSRNDEDRLSTALGKMLEEDLALRI